MLIQAWTLGVLHGDLVDLADLLAKHAPTETFDSTADPGRRNALGPTIRYLVCWCTAEHRSLQPLCEKKGTSFKGPSRPAVNAGRVQLTLTPRALYLTIHHLSPEKRLQKPSWLGAAGGALLLAVIVAFCVFAVDLYVRGQPGTPALSNELAATEGRISVYARSGLSVDVNVSYGVARGGDQLQSITVSAQTHDINCLLYEICPKEIALVELEGWPELTGESASRVDLPQIDLPRIPETSDSVYIEHYPRRIYVVPLNLDSRNDAVEQLLRPTSIVGDTRISALQSQNARTNFDSPSITVRSCPGIPHSSAEILKGDPGDAVRVLDASGESKRIPCDGSPDPASSGRLLVSKGFDEVGATRIDVARPEPVKSQSALSVRDQLEWRWRAADEDYAVLGFRAQASYVNINEESRGQSRIFVAGILIGLAGGFLPIALGSLYRAVRGQGSVSPPNAANSSRSVSSSKEIAAKIRRGVRSSPR